jgi:hypothetical protein
VVYDRPMMGAGRPVGRRGRPFDICSRRAIDLPDRTEPDVPAVGRLDRPFNLVDEAVSVLMRAGHVTRKVLSAPIRLQRLRSLPARDVVLGCTARYEWRHRRVAVPRQRSIVESGAGITGGRRRAGRGAALASLLIERHVTNRKPSHAARRERRPRRAHCRWNCRPPTPRHRIRCRSDVLFSPIGTGVHNF